MNVRVRVCRFSLTRQASYALVCCLISGSVLTRAVGEQPQTLSVASSPTVVYPHDVLSCPECRRRLGLPSLASAGTSNGPATSTSNSISRIRSPGDLQSVGAAALSKSNEIPWQAKQALLQSIKLPPGGIILSARVIDNPSDVEAQSTLPKPQVELPSSTVSPILPDLKAMSDHETTSTQPSSSDRHSVDSTPSVVEEPIAQIQPIVPMAIVTDPLHSVDAAGIVADKPSVESDSPTKSNVPPLIEQSSKASESIDAVVRTIPESDVASRFPVTNEPLIQIEELVVDGILRSPKAQQIEIDLLKKQLAERDLLIKHLSGTTADTNAELTKLYREYELKRREIDQQSVELKRDQDRLQNELYKKDAELRRLEATVSKVQVDSESQIQMLTDQLVQAEGRMNAAVASTMASSETTSADTEPTTVRGRLGDSAKSLSNSPLRSQPVVAEPESNTIEELQRQVRILQALRSRDSERIERMRLALRQKPATDSGSSAPSNEGVKKDSTNDTEVRNERRELPPTPVQPAVNRTKKRLQEF